MIRKDPGVIVGPVAKFLGWIVDFIFNVVFPFTEKNSLGISIIVLTLVIRFLMLPLAVKSQKSMMAMQKLSPDIDKIRKKYGDSKDTETQQKMNTEIQALYAKNKVSPFGGCLPMLIQMPIFIGLSYVMDQSFLYITKLRAVYESLAKVISEISGVSAETGYPNWADQLIGLGAKYLPKNFGSFQFIATDLIPEADKGLAVPDITAEAIQSNLIKLLNRLSTEDWGAVNKFIAEHAAPGQQSAITSLYQQKQNIEMFLGMNMLNQAGWMPPGVLIPILTALTTFLTSWLSMKMTTQTNKDPSAMMQQRVMMAVMPLMMGFFTINYPVGVGIYWITSSVFQVIQQAFLNKKYSVASDQKEDTKRHVG